MEYGMCDRVVTVYRKTENGIAREVVYGCYYTWQQEQTVDEDGCRKETKFLLIMPGDIQRVFVGDRVYDGVGPEIGLDDWTAFIPAAVPGLAEAEYVLPCYFDGKLCHVEAGRK